MTRGKGGGVLLEGYVLDKSLVTDGEKDDILAALSALRATGAADSPRHGRKHCFNRKAPIGWTSTFRLGRAARIQERLRHWHDGRSSNDAPCDSGTRRAERTSDARGPNPSKLLFKKFTNIRARGAGCARTAHVQAVPHVWDSMELLRRSSRANFQPRCRKRHDRLG